MNFTSTRPNEYDVDDQPILVATKMEDHSVVADEIDGAAELSFYGGRVTMTADPDLGVLVTFLQRVPGIVGTIGNGRLDDGLWWVKFGIDIDHPLAWNVVQEFGCVLKLPFLERSISHRVHTRVPSAISERWPASIPLVDH